MLARNTLFSGLLALSVSILSQPVCAGGKVYGSGSPKSSSSLPAGDFRSSIDALSTGEQKRALQWLQSVEFTQQDLPYMRVDSQGGIYYADTFSGGKSKKTAAGKDTASGLKAVTAKNVLKLHSRRGADKIIFVDFDGGTVAETAWNKDTGVKSWKTLPYDTDGKPKSFSAAEVNAMASIWHRIAEDYAPFDVDVTTEDPGKTRAKVVWVLVTDSQPRSKQPLPAADSSSVAYMNVFGFSHTAYYSPALVYYNNLTSPDVIAEASSHSVGHILGLSHDGKAGTGKGKLSWSPIMGLNHPNHVTQWSKGDYRGALNTQNDIGILIGALGSRGDDHDDSRFDKGTPLVVDNKGVIKVSTPETDPKNQRPENKGLIEDKDDVDVFAFKAGAGVLDITVTPAWQAFNQGYHRGANLDVHIAIYDESGKKVAEHNPSDETNSRLKKRIKPGSYKLEVQGVGNNSYSSYGSIGQYYISGSIPPAGRQTTALAKPVR
jgi:hypothetical protein